MPLGNGLARSLNDEMTRDAGAQTIHAQPLFQQGNLQPTFLSEAVGLQKSAQQTEPVFLQRPFQPRGVMDSFVKTCQRWGLSQREELILLGYGGDSEFLGLQLLLGRLLSVPQDVKDRAGYILGISIGLGAIFDEVAHAEVTWLKNGHPKLRGTTPLNLMLNGKMVSLMTVARLVAEEREL